MSEHRVHNQPDVPDAWGSVQSFIRMVERDLRPTLNTRVLTGRPQRQPVVLLEMTKLASAQLANAYLATALAQEHDARIVAYRFRDEWTTRERIRRRARRSAPEPVHAVYEAFCDDVIDLSPRRRLRDHARVRTAEFLGRSPNLSALEQYAVGGAVLGDVILDKHVQQGNPRVRIDHPGIEALIEQMTARALVLHEWFEPHNVIATISSGLAVTPAIPLRVALARNVPAFPTTFDYSWRLTPEHPNWSRDYEWHRENFAQLDADAARAALDAAEEFLQGSLGAGGAGAAQLGSTSSWARRPLPAGLLPPKAQGQRTVLVAAHSFSDSPHSIGTTLFPDFYTWLEHLADLAARSDYEWLFKLHPDERDRYIGVRPALEALLAPLPNVRIIPADTSHWALLERGVDLALTVYGSIAVEYPSLGIPVIVAWPEGFTSGYSFALRPSTVAEYDRMILDPREWAYDIPRDELLEYVYCHYLWPRRPGVFRRVPVIAEQGQDSGAFKRPPFHDLWADGVTPEDAAEVLRVHRDWVRSGSYSRNAFDQPVGLRGTA